MHLSTFEMENKTTKHEIDIKGIEIQLPPGIL